MFEFFDQTGTRNCLLLEDHLCDHCRMPANWSLLTAIPSPKLAKLDQYTGVDFPNFLRTHTVNAKRAQKARTQNKCYNLLKILDWWGAHEIW